MNTSITLEDVSLSFRVYKNKSQSVKEWFTHLLSKEKHEPYTEFWALSNINITVNHGDRLGIVGHNGAGKSTLLKTICNIYTPTKGNVRVEGRVAPLLEIGAGFNTELSGRDNIYLNGAILGHTKSTLRSIESEIISFTELGDFIDQPVKYYSTGMYMKLAFAIATAVHPEILILDELFAGGDAEFIDKAKNRMHEFIEKSGIMVFVSHQPDLLLQLCNRVIWLDHGKVIADGNPHDVIQRYLNKQFPTATETEQP